MPLASVSRLRAKQHLQTVGRTPRPSFRGGMEALQPIQEGRPMTRSQAKLKDKFAALSQGGNTDIKDLGRVPFSLQLEKSAAKSSHPSVSLFSPPHGGAMKPNKRTSLPGNADVSTDPDRSSPMDIDLMTPQASNLSSTVLGMFNRAKENATTGLGRKSSYPLRPSMTPDPGTFTKLGGLRGRQVNEEMERGGEEGNETRIMVYVRLRPMSKKEKEAGARTCVKIDGKRDVYLTEMALETDYLRLKRLRGRHFAFDSAFPENTSQEEVYQTSTADLVEGVLEGRNSSVFCYGATGAGKTHTMLGSVHQPGVMVLALKDLFCKLKERSPDGEHVVRLSYLEVYNETVRDLLSPGRALVLREDARQGITAAGLTQYQAFSAEEVMTLLHKGNTNRQTEPTRVNETSSRSHAILQVVVEYSVEHQSGKYLRVGKLSLIDLAGSERALATEQRTLRSVEGANINRSLLALSSCINALVEGRNTFLSDSLGGACSTAMIANVSPSNNSFGETQNTLHWADRAKEIKTKGNEVNGDLPLVPVAEDEEEKSKLLAQVQKENQMLRLQVARLERSIQLGQYNAATPCTPAIASGRNSLEPIAPQETLARRGEFKTMADKKIWELQRTVELLEMEAEKARRDGALREEKMNASILALTAEHSQQLRRKDEYIRSICNAASPGPAVENAVASPIRCLEKILSQRATNKVMDRPEKAATAGDKSRRFVTPKATTAKSGALPPSSVRPAAIKGDHRPITGTVTRRMNRSLQQQAPPSPSSNLIKTPTRSRFSCSPSKPNDHFASCRKRTFWDITNSPNSHLRSPQPSNGSTSMLRQPGFARRKTSPESDQ